MSSVSNNITNKHPKTDSNGFQCTLKITDAMYSGQTFSLWSEPLSKEMVHDGAHADKALLAQGVPVHAAQGVYCFIHLITVDVLEDEFYQAQLSSSEDTCHKTSETR